MTIRRWIALRLQSRPVDSVPRPGGRATRGGSGGSPIRTPKSLGRRRRSPGRSAMLPEPVDDHPRRQRVVGACEPLGQGRADGPLDRERAAGTEPGPPSHRRPGRLGQAGWTSSSFGIRNRPVSTDERSAGPWGRPRRSPRAWGGAAGRARACESVKFGQGKYRRARPSRSGPRASSQRLRRSIRLSLARCLEDEGDFLRSTARRPASFSQAVDPSSRSSGGPGARWARAGESRPDRGFDLEDSRLNPRKPRSPIGQGRIERGWRSRSAVEPIG